MVTDSLFRISQKYSAHFLDWVSSVVRGFPSLSLTMLILACVCLQSCLVGIYNLLISPLSAAVTTLIAILSA